MRAIGGLGAVVLLAACATAAAETAQTPQPPSCAVYSSTTPTIQLTNADGGRSITAKVCDAIWIVITGSQGFVGPSPGWQFPQSSDTSVLEVVPLPLPHPENGVEAVYRAIHSGRAMLSSQDGISNCPPNAMCLSPDRWSVTVTVTT